MIQEIQLSAINRDTNNQMRDGIRDDVVDEYATAMRDGATFPPVVVFSDGGNRYHLADGFHRVEAARAAGIDVIRADVRDGDQRAARLYAAGANATHGLRRTNADKRRSVMALLEDDEWSAMSDREIARHCGVTHPFVGKLRAEIEAAKSGNRYRLEDDAIEGRARLSYQSDRAAENIRKWESHLRYEVRVMAGLLTDVRHSLAGDQYDKWLKSEFKLTASAANELERIATDDTPAFLDRYLTWLTNRTPAAEDVRIEFTELAATGDRGVTE